DVCWSGTITKAKEDSTSSQHIHSENYKTIKVKTTIVKLLKVSTITIAYISL
ncbi:unnamed protein product, partial [Prunus brigantina]